MQRPPESSRGPALLLVACACWCLVHPARATAYCLNGTDWSGQDQIPVLVLDGTQDEWLHADDSSWSKSEIRWEVEWAIAALSNTSQSGIPPLYFAGWYPCEDVNENGGYDECYVPGHIVIMSNATGSGLCGAYANGDVSGGVAVVIENSFDCPARWEQWEDGEAERSDILVSTLAHELGHAVGLAHPFDCTESPSNPECVDGTARCQVMGFGWNWDYRQLEYYLDDIRGFQAIYGTYSPGIAHQLESIDGAANWATLGPPGGLDPAVLTWGAGLSGNSSVSGMFLITRQEEVPHAYLWDWSSATWSDWGAPSGADVTVGSMGAAHVTIGESSGVFVQQETQGDIRKDLVQSVHSDDSTSSSASLGTTTYSHGVDAAFDPQSQLWVYAWRNDAHEVVLQVEGGSPVVLEESTNRISSMTTPSLVCAPAVIERNCVIVWVNAKPRQSHWFRWAHFVVDGGSFDFGAIGTAGYVMFDRPQIAYAHNLEAGEPGFVAVFPGISTGNGDRWIVSAVKGLDETSSWDDKENVVHFNTAGDINYTVGATTLHSELLIFHREGGGEE